MSADLCGSSAWGKPNIVNYYAIYDSLQPPEAMILVRHRDDISDGHILEVGCGGGRLSWILKKLGRSYVGIDFCQEMVAVCEQRFKSGDFMVADVRNMSIFKSNTFDFVMFAFNGIDSIEHEGRLRAMREIQRVLKPGKLFVFSSHNRNYRCAEKIPKLCLCVNPFTQVKNICTYIIQMKNVYKTRKDRKVCDEYAVYSTEEHNYEAMYYYIGKAKQKKQAEDLGFEIIDMYDLEGNVLDEGMNDSHTAWVYYVARKMN